MLPIDTQMTHWWRRLQPKSRKVDPEVIAERGHGGVADTGTDRDGPLVTESDRQFIRTNFRQMEGWCLDEAAYLTCCLMSCQHQSECSSGALEIGVYRGKYLSVLYQKARQFGQPVVGIDPFEWSPRQTAVDALTRAFGSLDGLALVTADSRSLNAGDLLAMLGNVQPSFISIDGDHSSEAVRSDLVLATAALRPGGIIAVDDFMNPRAMGVSEGVYRYFLLDERGSMRPFAHCGNKLFVAERHYHEMYCNAISLFFEQEPTLPMVQQFNSFRNLGPSYVEQHILGVTVIAV
jgi:hypothetical protein